LENPGELFQFKQVIIDGSGVDLN